MSDSVYTLICGIAFLFHLWMLLWCYRKNPLLFAGMLTFFNSMLLTFISLYFIERGFKLFELNQDGFRNYAYLMYCLFSIPIIWLTAKIKFSKKFINKVQTTSYEKRPRFFVLFLLMFNLAFLSQPEFRSSWLSGNKFEVLSFSALGTQLYFINNFVIIIAAYYLFNSSKKYYVAILLLVLMNGVIRHATTSTLVALAFPVILRMVVQNGCRYYFPKVFMLVIPSIAGLALFIRNLYLDPEVSSITIYDRIISQGQLFWVSLNERYKGDLLDILVEYVSNSFSLKNLQLHPDFGLGHFMIAVSKTTGAAYVEGGVTFAAAPPGMFIYYFNLPVGWLLYIVAACVTLYVTKWYIQALLTNKLVEFIVLNLLLNYFVLNFFLMGEYANFNLRALLFFVTYLVVKFFSQKSRWSRTLKYSKPTSNSSMLQNNIQESL